MRPILYKMARLGMARGSFRIRPGTVRVRVLDPVDAGRYSYEERDQLTSEVRGPIAAALAEAGEGVARAPEGAIGGVSA